MAAERMDGEGVGNVLLEKEHRPAPKHHEKFDQALQNAVDAISPGDPGWFEVKLFVHVSHSSPGWVDGYRIQLSP
jgi:hypothetical protein